MIVIIVNLMRIHHIGLGTGRSYWHCQCSLIYSQKIPFKNNMVHIVKTVQFSMLRNMMWIEYCRMSSSDNLK